MKCEFNRARKVSDLQKEKGFKGVIAATRKTTPGRFYKNYYKGSPHSI